MGLREGTPSRMARGPRRAIPGSIRGCRLCRRPLGEAETGPERKRQLSLGSKGVAFFLPGIGVVVVAVALPEARLVEGGQLDRAQPLGALPEVLAGDDQAKRAAVVRGERHAVRLGGEQSEVVLEGR